MVIGPLCPGQLQEDPVGGHAAAAGARGAARQGDRHQEDAQRRRGQKVGRTYKEFTYYTYNTGAKVDVNKWNNIRKRVYGDTFINGSLNYAVSPVSPPEIGACMLCAFSKYYREILLAPWHLFPSCLVPCRVGGDSARSKWRDRYRGHPPVSNGQTDTKVRLESGKNNKTSLW